eukprot:4081081-Pyramimonas_sp.AAC.1
MVASRGPPASANSLPHRRPSRDSIVVRIKGGAEASHLVWHAWTSLNPSSEMTAVKDMMWDDEIIS